jgi:hypothetical protein
MPQDQAAQRPSLAKKRGNIRELLQPRCLPLSAVGSAPNTCLRHGSRVWRRLWWRKSVGFGFGFAPKSKAIPKSAGLPKPVRGAAGKGSTPDGGTGGGCRDGGQKDDKLDETKRHRCKMPPQQLQQDAKHRQFRFSRGSERSPDLESARTFLQKSGLGSHVGPQTCDFAGPRRPFPEARFCSDALFGILP